MRSWDHEIREIMRSVRSVRSVRSARSWDHEIHEIMRSVRSWDPWDPWDHEIREIMRSWDHEIMRSWDHEIREIREIREIVRSWDPRDPRDHEIMRSWDLWCDLIAIWSMVWKKNVNKFPKTKRRKYPRYTSEWGCVIMRKSNRPFIEINGRLELRIITQPYSAVYWGYLHRLVFGNSLTKHNKLISFSYSVVIW